MRIGVMTAGLALVTFGAQNAHALEHYLFVRASTLGHEGAISAPDLSPFVEVTHEDGVAGVDPINMHNHAEVHSDSGYLAVAVVANQPSGTTLTPNGWTPAARLEETFHKTGPSTATGMKVTLSSTAGAIVANATPLVFEAHASLRIGSCNLHLTKKFASTGAVLADEFVDGCSGVLHYTGTRTGSELTIEIDQLNSATSVEAQVDIEINYAGGFVGAIDGNVTGSLVVEAIGGSLTPASPTFGTLAPGVDGGTSHADSGSSGSEDAGTPSGSDAGPSGGPSDPNNGQPATGGGDIDASLPITDSLAGSDDSGCHATPGSARTPTTAFALMFGALLSAIIARRSRHGRGR